MKNESITSKIGMAALLIALFSSTIVFANGTSDLTTDNNKSKAEIAAQKLESTVMVDQQLIKLESDLIEEGVLSCNNDVMVKVLNQEDEVIYEGTYDGIEIRDKTLKKYMVKADLLVNVGDVAYYMLF